MIRHLLLPTLLLATVGACTERLTTPGTCPALCPGGEVEVRDTVIDATFGADSSIGGFTSQTEPVSLLLSTGVEYGESRAVVKFVPRGDSIFVGDSLRTFTVDSVLVQLILQKRDTTASGLVLDVYRLPRSVDTLITVEELDALMTPAALLRSVAIVDSARAGPFPLTFKGADLADLAFTPADSTQLVLGLRLRAPGSAAARFGAARAGGSAPQFLSFVHVNVSDTALQRRSISRVPQENFSVRPPTLPPTAAQLQVGGYPATRSFVRFDLPPYLEDSVTIVRATLELDGVTPIKGLPGDSVQFNVRGLLTDFGAKSPVVNDRGASVLLTTGIQDVSVDITTLVTLWQGDAPLPNAIRLDNGSEWGTFFVPTFFSTRSSNGGPRLRITYRPRFPFEGF